MIAVTSTTLLAVEPVRTVDLEVPSTKLHQTLIANR